LFILFASLFITLSSSTYLIHLTKLTLIYPIYSN